MATKKKSSAKKTKKTSDKPQYLPLIYSIPPYEDPSMIAPKVRLILKLVSPVQSCMKLEL